MNEEWVIIPEFPIYSISNFGRVMNESTGRLMKENKNAQGTVKVGLMDNGKQYTRSVKVLVAHAFVDGYSDIFNTVIQLDNNEDNLYAGNLMWRPRWFASEYSRQFEVPSENDHIGPLIETGSGDWYKDVYLVGVTHGLLFSSIRINLGTNKTVFPTFLRFELL